MFERPGGFTERIASSEYRRAVERAATFGRERINPEEFIDVYGKGAVEQDMKRVEELKARCASEEPEALAAKEKAQLLEAIVAERLREGNWFGENASASATSEYDDWVNGVDEIVGFMKDGAATHMGMAFDVTFSTQLDRKFARVHDELARGELAKVRYFKSGPYTGQLEVPRVIVGLDHTHLERLAALWGNPEQEERLRSHPFRRMLAMQILPQLETYAKFAAAKRHDRVRSIVDQVCKTFENEVRIAGVVDDDWLSDRVHATILEKVRTFDQR